ncbi:MULTISPECIES: hypothetical protein [Rahnella]|uniref:hypothetical protein n=1 Tax=Rahnella TaxID=34037 RepID=UPI003D277C27
MKVVVIVLSLALISDPTHAKSCTERDAEAADLAIDNLDSWEAIQKNYVAYAQCDDGSIAEGNSEAIARMLIDKWQDIAKLQIIILSSESCPAENKALCGKLIAAAKSAEK